MSTMQGASHLGLYGRINGSCVSYFAYLGHHKCATQWIKGILNEVCAELALRLTIFNSPTRWSDDKTLGCRVLRFQPGWVLR